MAQGDAHLGELRLLLEELCCDLCRFEHVIKDQLGPETIRIDREYWLGAPGAFADIRVCPPGEHPYFVEVKFGYTREMLLRHLARKYKSYVGENGASKVVLVIDRTAYSDWDQLQRDVVACLHAGLELEVWDEDRLLSLLAERFGVTIPQITPDDLLDVRQAIDRAKGFHAFGGPSLGEYEHDPLKAELLWHFGFWRLKHLRSAGRRVPRETFCHPRRTAA